MLLKVSDPEDPKSVVNLLPENLKRRYDGIPDEFWDMSISELESHTTTGRFSNQDKLLRVSFWNEYNRVCDHQLQMNVTNIVKGVCSRRHFLEKVCTDPIRLVFVMTPPADYKVSMEETLSTLVEKLRQIADLPIKNEEGEPIYKNIELIMKAFPHVDNRVRGSAVQRIESKSVSLNVEHEVPNTVQDIDKRLRELESKTITAIPAGDREAVRIGAIDVPMHEIEDAEEKT